MIEFIKKLSYFLHISDGGGQLDIVDIAFIAIMIKILMEPTPDWASVTGLVGLLVNNIHNNYIDSKKD